MKVVITGFINTMSKPQKAAGLIYLPFHFFIIPLFLGMAADWLPNGGPDDMTATLIYYGVGFVFCLAIMWKYLRNAFDQLLDNKAVNITAMIFGYFSYIILGMLASTILLAVMGDGILNQNNEAAQLSQENTGIVVGLAVFIAPIVEEILFRGVVFGSLREKHRRLAMVASILLFAIYNVWQYALVTMDWRMLLYIIEYIPAGYALAWVYEKTNCIWMPIFLHMFINGIAVFA